MYCSLIASFQHPVMGPCPSTPRSVHPAIVVKWSLSPRTSHPAQCIWPPSLHTRPVWRTLSVRLIVQDQVSRAHKTSISKRCWFELFQWWFTYWFVYGFTENPWRLIATRADWLYFDRLNIEPVFVFLEHICNLAFFLQRSIRRRLLRPLPSWKRHQWLLSVPSAILKHHSETVPSSTFGLNICLKNADVASTRTGKSLTKYIRFCLWNFNDLLVVIIHTLKLIKQNLKLFDHKHESC